MEVSKRINNIEVSHTTNIFAKAIELQESGLDVINLGVGEPDFNTPQNVNEAAISAINSNYTKYTVNAGILPLRKAIANKIETDHDILYQPSEIIISCGAKQSVYSAFQAILNAGDEVLVPAPYWVSYTEMVKLADGIPVIVETKEENKFRLQPEDLENAITPKTRALILCNPSNPTGSAYNKEEMEAIAKIIVENDIYVISDEIYQKLVYDNFKSISFPSIGEEVKKRTILINGVSKSYSMTGWRIGFAAGPENVIAAMNKLQSHLTSNASSISQFAALEAYTGEQDDVEKMRLQFEKRRNYLYKEINAIEGMSCFLPEGAFYLFINVKKLLDKSVTNSFDFALHCLNKGLVAGVPGSAFGAEGYYRLSYATSMDNLIEAARRLKECTAELI